MPDIIKQMKQNAAKAAMAYIEDDQIIGVGSGSTVEIFIKELANIKHKIAGAIASSVRTAELLKQAGIRVLDLNVIDNLPIYIDGADAYNEHHQLIKGGGGCLTREKILAYASNKFICITSANKKPGLLDHIKVPIEVIPMARSIVGRELMKLGARLQYRENFITDNGNIILDAYDLDLTNPLMLEEKIKQVTGVVESGIFSRNIPSLILIGQENGVTTL